MHLSSLPAAARPLPSPPFLCAMASSSIEALPGVSTMGKTFVDAEGNVSGGTFWAPMVRARL